MPEIDNCVIDLPVYDHTNLNELMSKLEENLKTHSEVLVLPDLKESICTISAAKLLGSYNFNIISSINLEILILAVEHSSYLSSIELCKFLINQNVSKFKLLIKKI